MRIAEISWLDVMSREVTDGLGRRFRWPDLRGKTIYICGHGMHHLKDGFYPVPPNSTLTFHTNWGIGTGPKTVGTIVAGGQVPVNRELVAQLGPNLSVFPDDLELVKPTFEALARNPARGDSYVFNCNYFVPWSLKRREFKGKPSPYVTLGEIFEVIHRGNRFVWACCQDLDLKKTGGVKEPDTARAIRDTQVGRLRAKLSTIIRAQYNDPGDPQFSGCDKGTASIEGQRATAERLKVKAADFLPFAYGRRLEKVRNGKGGQGDCKALLPEIEALERAGLPHDERVELLTMKLAVYEILSRGDNTWKPRIRELDGQAALLMGGASHEAQMGLVQLRMQIIAAASR
jgi:hypothetical protein